MRGVDRRPRWGWLVAAVAAGCAAVVLFGWRTGSCPSSAVPGDDLCLTGPDYGLWVWGAIALGAVPYALVRAFRR